MADLVTDRDDPRLGHGVDSSPVPQNEAYLVLPEAERRADQVRPLRLTYRHVGPTGPTHPTLALTLQEAETYGDLYVAYEPYPKGSSSALGRFWTQAQLDAVGKGCRSTTTMSRALGETYAREPKFYGATYCITCSKHLPVDEFVWADDGERVGS